MVPMDRRRNPAVSIWRSGEESQRRPAGLFGALLLVAVLLAACGTSTVADVGKAHKASPTTTETTTTPTTGAPTTGAGTGTGPVCPLTGTPMPGGGAVPARPALAVKVTNYPTGRPQSGLNDADIVFEEPVEGGITRYVAIFECGEASSVGPIRSARNIDVGILGQFGAPLLASMGGIQPVISNIEASPIIELNLLDHGTATVRVPGRVAPYNTFASTSDLWALRSTDTTAPPPVFSYSDTVPSGAGVSPVTSVSIPFSSYSTVVWRYAPTTHAFERYYDTTADRLSTGGQVSATNVVVEFVQITYGPWVENTSGALEVQANLYTDASGPAIVFRDGKEISGEWARTTLSEATRYTTSSGQPISLQPGRTWVELVPNTVNVTADP